MQNRFSKLIKKFFLSIYKEYRIKYKNKTEKKKY